MYREYLSNLQIHEKQVLVHDYSKQLVRMSVSAARERGSITHSKGSGYLHPECQPTKDNTVHTSFRNKRDSRQDPVRHLALQTNRPPVLSKRRADRKRVQDRRDDHEERRLGEVSPGTYPVVVGVSRSSLDRIRLCIITHRRPYPNAIVAESRTSGFSFPSFRNRSGMNASGSGYTLGSREYALRTHAHVSPTEM